jgi:hypothetical protein
MNQPTPGLNTGEPWSAWDDKDLRHCAEQGDSVSETALFLQRSTGEVLQRAKELKIEFAALRELCGSMKNHVAEQK